MIKFHCIKKYFFMKKLNNFFMILTTWLKNYFQHYHHRMNFDYQFENKTKVNASYNILF